MKSSISNYSDGTNYAHINVGNTERVASALAGGLLFVNAVRNIRRRPAGSVAALVAGSALMIRGGTGYCAVNNAIGRDSAQAAAKGLTIKETVTVNRPAEEVYNAWRRLENLPSFMRHIESVKEVSPGRSHWVAKATDKFGKIEWDAEITAENSGESIKWKSLPGSKVDNTGEVVFKEAPGNRGTEVHATISYVPPAGDAGRLVARAFNGVFEQMVREDIRRFKRMIETGELPTIKDNPSARNKTEIPIAL